MFSYEMTALAELETFRTTSPYGGFVSGAAFKLAIPTMAAFSRTAAFEYPSAGLPRQSNHARGAPKPSTANLLHQTPHRRRHSRAPRLIQRQPYSARLPCTGSPGRHCNRARPDHKAEVGEGVDKVRQRRQGPAFDAEAFAAGRQRILFHIRFGKAPQAAPDAGRRALLQVNLTLA